MARYIDAEPLAKDTWMLYRDEEHIDYNVAIVDALNVIDEQPTADVIEVKHGRWIEDRLCTTNGGTYGVRRCSVCEDYYQDVGYGWNYCPHCGAKMDEREEEE